LESDEEDSAEVSVELSSTDFSSVLDECSMFLQSIPNPFLKWHYRSRHESLIAYSNYQFYNHGLITFPSAYDKHETLGVQFVHVPDGVYDRGGKRNNPREAQVVADLVFNHFARYPQKSLGVVAFSQAQMNTIDDEIELRRREHPELEGFFKDDRLQGFFVKNLENVQGDERDVIIFSVGYGYDQNHRITMNFGPLNRPGGERRLNVAVTRARDKIYFVSSIKASDFDLSSTASGGALHLYRYLDYAERGQVALELVNPQGTGEAESPLEEDVSGEIRRMGYEVSLQVGVSSYRIDLGVLDPSKPGHFLLGVECDGATYHSAATARDRDRLRQQILEKLGWRIHRIWSPDWVSRRQAEIERLRKSIDDARARGSHTDILDTPASGILNVEKPILVERVAIEREEFGIALPGTMPYQLCQLEIPQWAGTEFYESKYRDVQANLIRRIVAREGPIHIELLARRLLDAWGVSRRGTRITDAIVEAVRYDERRLYLTLRGKFLWPPGFNDAAVRTPNPSVPDTMRDIDYISPEELQAAILLVAKHALSLNIESLINATARLFGFVRTTDKISLRLTTEYQTLLRNGIFNQRDNLVSLR
jgi:very-short-patch-repair endonuclease